MSPRPPLLAARSAAAAPCSPGFAPHSHQRYRYENVVHTEKGFLPESEAKAKGLKPSKLSGTEFRRLLRAGEPIPDWFAFKSVIDVLRKHELASGGSA